MEFFAGFCCGVLALGGGAVLLARFVAVSMPEDGLEAYPPKPPDAVRAALHAARGREGTR